jgi:hypothetical protein
MIGIASGIEATGALDYLSHYMLSAGMTPPSQTPPAGARRPDSAAGAEPPAAEDGLAPAAKPQWYRSAFFLRNVSKVRMFSIVAGISAFINNTPLVAIMIPVIERFCRRFRLPTSQMMMPLSYAAIVGGLMTIIGTSTNLIVKGEFLCFHSFWFCLFCVVLVLEFARRLVAKRQTKIKKTRQRLRLHPSLSLLRPPKQSPKPKPNKPTQTNQSHKKASPRTQRTASRAST